MIADQFTYWGYSVGWSTLRRLPERRAHALFRRFADQVWRQHGKSVKQYERNLGRVVPDASTQDLRDMSRGGLRSYARYWCDAFRMPDWPKERILGQRVEGLEHIERALETGNGRLVLAGTHGGNYDHGAAFMAQRFGSLTTVAERLEPTRLFDKFVAFRRELGMEVLGTGTPDLTAVLVQRAEAGTIVGLVADRDLSRHGVEVEFFGEPTSMPPGPAVVARRTGATLLAASFQYRDADSYIVVSPPIEVPTSGSEREDVATTVQAIARAFERGIRSRPTDWHMLQPLWYADLDPERLRRTREARARG